MTEKMSVAVRTLGCKVNRVESEDIVADLAGRGASLVDEHEAQVVIINTCTVTGEADAKARKAVRQALAGAGNPVVVVTGCLAALDAPALESLGERVVIEVDKERVADRVAKLLGAQAPEARLDEAPVRMGAGFRTRVQLKVQDGCDCFCSYCIVPYARGVPRSVPLERIEKQASGLVRAGAREIVLTGINLGRYRDGEARLSAVVRTVAGSGASRIRLSSIEPMDLDAELLDTLANTPEVCAHLHVPLQSGSDRVLAAMRRGYTRALFEDRIADLRSAMPDVAITTDLIAGFPGETQTDHAASLDAARTVGFSKLHVFRYSARRNTPAADMVEQVPAAERARRATELRDLGDRLRAEFADSRTGRKVEVLIESVRAGVAKGTTREYLQVDLPADGLEVGQLVSVSYRPSAV